MAALSPTEQSLTMTDTLDCPVPGCQYSDTLNSVLDHFSKREGSEHQWANLDYESARTFRISYHDEQMTKRRKKAEIAADTGDYSEAVSHLEAALEHAQRGMRHTPDTTDRFDEECSALLAEISRVESAAIENQIAEYVTIAENRVSDGDDEHVTGRPDCAEEAYADAEQALEDAIALATDDLPEQVQSLQDRLDRVRLRQLSLETSDTHRRVIKTQRTAREYKDAGDSAFKQSDYQSALEAYQLALDAYDDVVDALDAFEFESTTEGATTCDLCQKPFDTALNSVQLKHCGRRRVCPACMHFAEDGALLTPDSVAGERKSVEEMTTNIKSGEYGLEWSTNDPINEEPYPDDQEEAQRIGEQELVRELVRVYQMVKGKPTVEDLDAETEFGYLPYKRRYGSIEDALEAAGFEIDS
jgi:tetratricopeptide (TPR) repeat protein